MFRPVCRRSTPIRLAVRRASPPWPHAWPFRAAILRAAAFLAAFAALAAVAVTASPAGAQGTAACDAFARNRSGNILQGICYATSNFVTGTRPEISTGCEQLIRLGGPNDLGDAHLARNVCKGVADPACDHNEFDVYAGPFVKNAACRAARGRCAEVGGDDRRMCDEVAALLVAGRAAGRRAAGATIPSAVPVRFRLPVEDAGLLESAWTGEPWNIMKGPFLVDHDPATRGGGRGLTCRDYMGRGGLVGAPFCYGGHTGADFVLRGGFKQMDVPDANWVVAAADGVVASVVDTLYDRCHAEAVTADGRFLNVDCDGRIAGGPSRADFVANTIVVRHAGGVETRYLHLRTRSAVVRPGQPVRCGQRLARIGSSGISSFPHLHFEVHDATGAVVDPFAGPLSQRDSWWVDQGPDHRRIPAARCAQS